MKLIKNKKKKNSFLLRIAVLAFAVYIVTAFVSQQMQISEKQQQLATMQKQIEVQQLQNDDIRHALSSGKVASDDYIERVARENLDYAKSGERVFVNIAGD